MVSRYVSAPIELSPAAASGDYSRADLIFHGVDHSLASYEGRVYINAPKANAGTGRNAPVIRRVVPHLRTRRLLRRRRPLRHPDRPP